MDKDQMIAFRNKLNCRLLDVLEEPLIDLKFSQGYMVAIDEVIYELETLLGGTLYV